MEVTLLFVLLTAWALERTLTVNKVTLLHGFGYSVGVIGTITSAAF